VVCTDANGNRDFCVDEANCVMPEARRAAVADAVHRLLADPALRARLGQAGIETASAYTWGPRIDALERFMFEIARPTSTVPSTDAVPEPRRR
jgi:glycosyltransferase involved in cell wall biosynthesis